MLATRRSSTARPDLRLCRERPGSFSGSAPHRCCWGPVSATPPGCRAARSGSAAPREGPGRHSLPGGRLARTDAPADPQKAWREAAAIRAGNCGDSVHPSGRGCRVGFVCECVRVSPCPRTAVGAAAAGLPGLACGLLEMP